MKNTLPAALLLGLALTITGCSQQASQKADNDVTTGINAVSNEAQKVEVKAQPTINKMDAQAKPKLAELDLGARVTAALRANANLPDSIRVDASPNGVRLRGTVDTAAQKALAGKIAKATLPAGKTVSNQLTVKG